MRGAYVEAGVLVIPADDTIPLRVTYRVDKSGRIVQFTDGSAFDDELSYDGATTESTDLDQFLAEVHANLDNTVWSVRVRSEYQRAVGAFLSLRFPAEAFKVLAYPLPAQGSSVADEGYIIDDDDDL